MRYEIDLESIGVITATRADGLKEGYLRPVEATCFDTKGKYQISGQMNEFRSLEDLDNPSEIRYSVSKMIQSLVSTISESSLL